MRSALHVGIDAGVDGDRNGHRTRSMASARRAHDLRFQLGGRFEQALVVYRRVLFVGNRPYQAVDKRLVVIAEAAGVVRGDRVCRLARTRIANRQLGGELMRELLAVLQIEHESLAAGIFLTGGVEQKDAVDVSARLLDDVDAERHFDRPIGRKVELRESAWLQLAYDGYFLVRFALRFQDVRLAVAAVNEVCRSGAAFDPPFDQAARIDASAVCLLDDGQKLQLALHGVDFRRRALTAVGVADQLALVSGIRPLCLNVNLELLVRGCLFRAATGVITGTATGFAGAGVVTRAGVVAGAGVVACTGVVAGAGVVARAGIIAGTGFVARAGLVSIGIFSGRRGFIGGKGNHLDAE